jgi:hypothetical protein
MEPGTVEIGNRAFKVHTEKNENGYWRPCISENGQEWDETLYVYHSRAAALAAGLTAIAEQIRHDKEINA